MQSFWTRHKANIQLHSAVLLFGFAAILGDLISLEAIPLVWWRLGITCVSLLFLVPVRKYVQQTKIEDLMRWMGIGVIVTIHWVTFFASIKLANASVALVCLATTTFFTAVFEPLLLKSKWRWHESMIGILMVPGMWLVVRSVDQIMMAGVLYGIISAMLLALFGVMNKPAVEKSSPMFITFVELFTGFLLLGIYISLFPDDSAVLPVGWDWIFLILLAIGCTTIGYVLVLYALRKLTAFSSMMAFNLEPIYGILLAAILLDDNRELDSNFYVGATIIVGCIFVYPLLIRRLGKR